jgi:hypothetical protein
MEHLSDPCDELTKELRNEWHQAMTHGLHCLFLRGIYKYTMCACGM